MTALHDSRKRILIIIAIFGLLCLAVVLVTVFVSAVTTKTRELTPITGDDLRSINAEISYSDKGAENYIYQSPLYNFQVEVNTTQYELSETSTGINIRPKQSDDVLTIRVENSKDDLTAAANAYLKYIASYPDVSVKSNADTQIDGSGAKQIQFSRKGFDNQTRNVTTLLAVKNEFYYEITFTGQNTTLLNATLSKFKFIDSSKVSTKAEYTSSLWGYSFSYNTKSWQIDATSSRSVYLSRRDISASYLSITIDSSEVSRFDLSGKENSYLSDKVQQRINDLQKTAGFNLVSKNEQQINDRPVVVIDYSAQNNNLYREYHVLHYNAYTRIIVNYKTQEQLNSADLSEFLHSFKFSEPTSGQVKGLDSNATVDEKVVLLAKPAVVRIYTKACGTFALSYSAQLPITSGKSYPVCAIGTGSGFYVNSDGYVATNGHVVVFSDSEIVYHSVYGGYSLQLLVNIFRDYYANKLGENSLTDQEIVDYLIQHPEVREEIARGLEDIVKNNSMDIGQHTDIYVQKGNKSFEMDKGELTNASEHYVANLIGYDYEPDSSLTNETASDVALLKVTTKGDYPALSLSDTTKTPVSLGSSVLVMGFPGVATDIQVIDKSSRGEETVTRGIVSSIKHSTGGRNLIQIDASIQSGNSGGPALDENSQVIGLATYGLNDTGAADFNFLRDVADLSRLMRKNGIDNKIGTTETKWRSGISLFLQGKFSAAIKDLESAHNSYAELEETQGIIDIAKGKIAQGLDVSDQADKNSIETFISKLTDTEKVLFGVVGILTVIIVIVLTILLIVLIKMRPKQAV